MNEAISTAEPVTTEGPVAASYDPDPVLENWLPMAALAWEGFLTHGPGSVLVQLGDSGPECRYRPGSPCPCHPITADTYDARRQIVFVLGDGLPMVIEGWPSPPDAYAATTAEMSDASVQ